MPSPKGSKFIPLVERRDFYPSNLDPLPAEITDLKARARKLSTLQKAAQKRNTAYLRAKNHNAEPRALRETAIVVGGVLGGVSLGAGLGGAFTKAWIFGLHSTADPATVLIPGAATASVCLALQGAASVGWLVASMDTNKRRANELVLKQYQEWTRSVKVQDSDLLDALLPRYKEPNPYDPTDDAFQFVVGENYGTEGNKFSNEAKWYGVPFAGLATGGTLVLGVSGTGKTASVLKNFMRQVLSWKADVDHDGSGRGMEKCAGLFLDPKGSFSEEVLSVLMAAGVDPVHEMFDFDDLKARLMSPLPYARHAEATRTTRIAEFEGKQSTRLNRRLISWLVEGKKFMGKLSNLGPLETTRVKVMSWATQEIDRRDRLMRDEKRRHLLGAFKLKQGRVGYRTRRNPKARAFRGRQKDYLELGFDDNRVQRIIGAHNRIQSASRLLIERITAHRTTVQNGAKLTPQDAEALNRKETVPLPSAVTSNRDPWRAAGEAPKPYMDALLSQFLASVEELMVSVFIASTTHQQITRGAINTTRTMELLAGVPATTVGDKDDMEAYADLRELVRSLAPTKDRPGEDVRAYRVRWMEREAGVSSYANNINALLERARNSLRCLEWHGGEIGVLRPIISDFKAFFDTMQMSLRDALGEAAIETEQEYGRGTVTLNPKLRAELQRVESYLTPAAIADFKSGRMTTFRMIESSLPSPRPKSEAERKALGARYSAPDPVTEIVESIAELRRMELALSRDMQNWMRQVLQSGASVTELLGDSIRALCARVEEHFGNTPGLNKSLQDTVKRGFDLLISDLMDLLPKHLGDAYGAWLIAYPGRTTRDHLSGVTSDDCAQAYATAEVEQEPIPFRDILNEASLHVLNSQTNFATHIHGAGPLVGILKLRYATPETAIALCDTVTKSPSGASVTHVQNMLERFVLKTTESVLGIIFRDWDG